MNTVGLRADPHEGVHNIYGYPEGRRLTEFAGFPTMKLALIGVGQAGGKIVETILEREEAMQDRSIAEHVMAINTAKSDLDGLSRIPAANRLLIGQTETGGHGVGGDSDLGAEIAHTELEEIQSSFSPISVHRVDAFLIVAGLGGGTGGGVAPVVAARLQELYEEPVYVLGILPGSDEGGIYTLNAARSLTTLVDVADNTLLFDNEAWRSSGESMDAGYRGMNQELVRQLEPIIWAGEVHDDAATAESVVDASEIINTLAAGGISVIGYAEDTDVQSVSTGSKGLLARFSRSSTEPIDSAEATNRITSLIRRAALGRLTVPADIGSTDRGLVVVAGPPEYLNRKGIERGRAWLEEETGSMQMRGGDFPWAEDRVAVAVLLAGLHDVSRIQELKELAVTAQRNLETSRGRHDEAMANLTADGLDPLIE